MMQHLLFIFIFKFKFQNKIFHLIFGFEGIFYIKFIKGFGILNGNPLFLQYKHFRYESYFTKSAISSNTGLGYKHWIFYYRDCIKP